jgi:hypothetical protein
MELDSEAEKPTKSKKRPIQHIKDEVEVTKKCKFDNKAPRLPPREAIKPDGDEAEIQEREVPLNARHNRVAPIHSLRTKGLNLEEDKAWWLEGAYDENSVPLRDAGVTGNYVFVWVFAL